VPAGVAIAFLGGLVAGSIVTAVAHRVPRGGAISTRNPLAELSLAALFAATVAVLWGEPAQLALGLVFVSLLVAITLTDLERRIIPNAFLLAAALCGVAIAAATDPAGLAERGAAALAAGGLLLAALLAYPDGMGMGDVKLAAVMGLYMGRSVAPALLVGFAAGAVYGLVLILRHGAAARKSTIPFGPCLALGGVVGLLAGDELINVYLDAFSS
jgi:leader peptidase (prepilin peptidase) / N-methyltransferase